MSSEASRELTRAERAAIRNLVVSMCANYDSAYGCLPLECSCFMLGKCWTGGYCMYFQNAVLPNDPLLEAAIMGNAVETRQCAECGQPFTMKGKKVYCSAECEKKALRKQKREYMRKQRVECGKIPY
jgi:hypothetical protein